MHDLDERPPAFDVRELAPLFKSWRAWNHDVDVKERPVCWFDGKPGAQDGIGHFCTIGGTHEEHDLPHAMRIDITPELHAWITSNMLKINHDQIYFSLILHDDGTATVWARYNQILGQQKLAEEIPIASIRAGMV